MFTKIFPNAVIFGLKDESANGGAIVNAPVAQRFFIALQMSLYSGG